MNRDHHCPHFLLSFALIREMGLAKAKPIVKQIIDLMEKENAPTELISWFVSECVTISRMVKAEKAIKQSVGNQPSTSNHQPSAPESLIVDSGHADVPEPTPGCYCTDCKALRAERAPGLN